ncbi:secreted RxLR effector protein 161-like [Manduca sexta]|uniref:secreted RxLR effector protein 161-like n=1 Tax=Manduca sexta TaxID=7130 RepID=UPI00188F7DE7|nr:secreted RxLR effector protein 161-like [Manduca sexta]
MQDANNIKTPMEISNGRKIERCDDEKAKNWPYRELIGSLMYLSVATRPDITNSVVKLAQFCNNPKQEDWIAAKRILRYLKGTINYGLVYKKTGEFVKGYCDADWGSCSINRRSFSGYVFILAGAGITWMSRKQRTVAASSCEAEYVSLAEAVKEGLYLQSLLNELGLERYASISLNADSRSAIFLAQDPVFHARSKHIDIKYHFVRRVLKDNKSISLGHVATTDMIADVLTKPLPSIKHYKCIDGIGLKSC